MGVVIDRPAVIKEHNQSCIKMCKKPVLQKQTKHIDVKYHFVGERVKDESVQLQYFPTEFMEAELLTKVLNKAKVKQHCRLCDGLQPDLGQSQFSLSGGVGVLRSEHFRVRQIN